MSAFKGAPRNVAGLKIAILTGGSLAWNPRVIKEARALARAQFDVVVFGANPDTARLEVDKAIALQHGFVFTSVAPATQINFISNLQAARRRIRGRLGRDLYKLFGISSRWQIGLFVPELLRAATKARANYYIAHLEQGVWVGTQLLKAGFRVGVDMEDWFSEDLLPEARRYRPVRLLQNLERTLLRHGAHATCPSRAMSDVLAEEYGCAPPSIVYNAFHWSERKSLDGLLKDRRDRRVPSIHWFSQTLGPGRGLEDLLAALPFLEHEAEIHLRGKMVVGFESWLSRRVPKNWRDQLFVHDLVSNDELLSRVAEHDIGFAGEMTYCRSRDLTVTNKILQYLLAGLAVVASDTAGQREVGEQAPDAVLLYPPGDSAVLATRLNALLGSSENLKRAKANALLAAEQHFCWEHQENVLLEAIAGALYPTR